MRVIVPVAFIVIIPFVIGMLDGVPPESTAGLILATLLIEYSAPVAGLVAGLGPEYTLVTVLLVGAGVIGVQYPVFDILCCHSGKVQGFLDWVRQKHANSPLIRRYGVLALAPAILTLGFYISPAISWLFGWDRKTSFLIMTTVYALAATGVLMAGLGIIHLIFG